MNVTFRKLHPHIGAEASALDLRQIHDRATLAALAGGMDEHATQRQYVYRHAWRDRDLVIWDNLATMHRSTPFDDATHRRELRRVTTLDVEVPAYA